MRCRQVKGLLPAHFNKELSEGDRRALEAHLAACSACHTHWRRLYRAERWLIHASAQSQIKRGPSVDFTASVMAAIVIQQQRTAADQGAQGAAREGQAAPIGESQAGVTPPLGPWVGWNASLLAVVLSGALLAILSVMVGVVAVGVLLTQPGLSGQVFTGLTQALAGLAAGISSVVTTLSVLADNQLLLAGVAVGYVALAVLWFRLMRHHDYERYPGYEEVES
jgi:anti-sigma factor RsiW